MNKAELKSFELDNADVITASTGGGAKNSFTFSGFWDATSGNATVKAEYETKSATYSYKSDCSSSPIGLAQLLHDFISPDAQSVTTNTVLKNINDGFLRDNEAKSKLASLFSAYSDDGTESPTLEALFKDQVFEWVEDGKYFRATK